MAPSPIPLSPAIAHLIERRIPHDETARQRLGSDLTTLAQTILETNATMNLTGDAEPELFMTRHIEDALLAAAAIELQCGAPAAGARVLDVGAGGGIPGLVWALLWPETHVTLLETRAKKVRFLARAAEVLTLHHATMLEGRAENLAHAPEHRARYTLVTARALAALPTLLEWTLPFASRGAWVAAIKSEGIDAEIQAAVPARARLGAPEAPVCSAYARSDGKRCIVAMFHKTAPTPPLYPRSGGAARQPW